MSHGARFTLDMLPQKMREQAAALLSGATPLAVQPSSQVEPPAPRRIRQAQTPELNKTEQRARDWLASRDIHTAPHALTFRLASGCKYTPDLCHIAADTGKITCYEVKGPMMRDDAVVKLKVAAESWQGSIRFVLLWEDRPGGRWNSQVIL